MQITLCATTTTTKKHIASHYDWYYQAFHECLKAGITDPLEFPLTLDVILGLEIAFKVKWHPQWESCYVVMILQDEPFIKQLKSPWEQSQVGHDYITDWKVLDGIYEFVVQWNGSLVDPLITTGWEEFMHYLALPYKYPIVDLQYYGDAYFWL
ncbi:hypothetical protein KIW84_043264 [Lathyrus oleraceus]|uniref:Uncharacterized protein n=1 Tax=Pisum sativum TaxID=3888 RepID=A0A9D4XER9_PEA|nr:hypothetical protein KIW84_043264 [Pisum sativum]